jgi:lactoylglutathione lyase
LCENRVTDISVDDHQFGLIQLAIGGARPVSLSACPAAFRGAGRRAASRIFPASADGWGRLGSAMATVEHVALWVADLERMSAFYAEYFSAEIGPRYENPRKHFASRFLRLAAGARIELMTRTQPPSRDGEGDGERLGLAHLAFSLGSRAAVDELTRRLAAAGFPVLGEPRLTGDGYYESVVWDPEGNRIELTI